MMFVISQDGIKQEQRKELMELAAISPEDQVGILNLFYLGVTLLQGAQAKKKKAEKKKVADPRFTSSCPPPLPPARPRLAPLPLRQPLALATPLCPATGGRRLRRLALRAAAQEDTRGGAGRRALGAGLSVHEAAARGRP